MRLTPLDILLIGMAIFFLIRLMKRGKRNDDQRQPPHDGSMRGPDGQGEEGKERRREASEAYERARMTWDHLSGDKQPTAPPAAPGPEGEKGFNEGEFLQGAKAMYARIRESWDNREMDDIRHFTTEKAFKEFMHRADNETRSAKTDILMVEATLADREIEGEQERAEVHYNVLMREGGSGNPTKQVREVWRFLRSTQQSDSMWALDAIKPVSASEAPQQ